MSAETPTRTPPQTLAEFARDIPPAAKIRARLEEITREKAFLRRLLKLATEAERAANKETSCA